MGNYIGTDRTGTLDLGNVDIGVLLADGAFNNVIGGTDPAAGNTIAFNGGNGVHLRLLTGSGNTIRSNSIFDNGGFGIDLGSDGVTQNDDGDVDTGPNDLLNFPTLRAQATNGDVVITATMDSSPNATYTVEFFSNTECDPSGYGEGMTLLGTASVTTDATGVGAATFTTARGALTGNVFTATATDEVGNTSEFSQCTAVSDFAVAVEPSSRTVTAGESVSYTVKVTAEGGAFDSTVVLSCSGMPEDATCSFSEDQVVPGSGEARSLLTIETAAPSKSVASTGQGIPGGPVAAWIGLLSLVALMALGRVCSRVRLGPVARVAGVYALLMVMVALLLLQVACGDDDTTAPTGGTQTGTYEFTVTGAWESVERTGEATLVVE
jgi:hypothetical protein